MVRPLCVSSAHESAGSLGPTKVLVCHRNEPPTDRVLVLVRVDAGVDDVAEEVVHDVGERLGTHHTVQRAYEHRLARLLAIRRVHRKRAVT